ncbi:hypothetical protein [Bradyrhizobium sp. CCBAU 53338]|uniref:DUF6894 family protein n=1 Tax=Bradyrhizobium sp. CCBAU 53338 TaxID=1325111 RepID=UPI0018BFEECA|nr:hypothetical protein XH90_09905 [Bradyrhizobium sp. CCBAU 53338]
MPRFYLHLVGDTPAHGVLGQDCADEREAPAHAKALARSLATEKPHLVRDGNSIAIVMEGGQEPDRIALASTTT